MKATTYSVPPIDNGEALTEGSSGQLEYAADCMVATNSTVEPY